MPGDYSFWDLHVAVQDAMDWLDYHLHALRPTDTGHAYAWEIGIPVEEDFVSGGSTIAGWTVPLASHFERAGDKMVYINDFGDS